jgi:hypothetical protein
MPYGKRDNVGELFGKYDSADEEDALRPEDTIDNSLNNNHPGN